MISSFKDSKEFGSILTIKNNNYTNLYELLNNFKVNNDLMKFKFQNEIYHLKNIIKQAEVLSNKYDVVVTNPPYMGNNGMNPNLKEYIKSNYPMTKTDLFAVFLEKGLEMVKEYGFNCMVTMQSWMFLSSFEKLRKNLIETTTISNLLHMDNMVMRIAFGTSATVFRKIKLINYNSTFYHVKLSDVENDVVDPVFFNDKNKFVRKQLNFDKIPGSPLAYWASNNILNDFQIGDNINNYIDSFQGIITGDNNKFLRYWWEINLNKISFDEEDMNNVDLINKFWIPYNKGGKFRKWYGNQDYVVNWKNGPSDKTRGKSTFSDFYLRDYVSWSYITSSTLSTRYFPKGFLWDVHGSGMFDKGNYLKYLQALLTSKVGITFLKLINPTLSFQVENILQIPVIYDENYKDKIDGLVKENIYLSKLDWDSFEISWNFTCHPFLKFESRLIKDCFKDWFRFQENFINKVHKNEISINEIMINIYNLGSEISSDVIKEDITLYNPDLDNDIKSFVSYAVGCMFGRYSLDHQGLQYAGGEFDLINYHKFIPDDDNIIPVLDSEYFEDDIVGRFVEFVKTCFGEETLEENLDFIANSLAKNKKPSREKIREYLLKNFFNDHKKTYKKCPIYWQFSSGKQNGFNCLVYMHRYEPSLVARIRTEYLHKTQKAIEQAISNCDNIINHSSSNTEIARATKDKSKLQKQLQETQEYDEALAHIANQNIEIDLDDGVKVNYAKFQNVEVSREGKKTKKVNLLKKL